MLHKFVGLSHTAAVRPIPRLSVKLAAAPDAVKQQHPQTDAK